MDPSEQSKNKQDRNRLQDTENRLHWWLPAERRWGGWMRGMQGLRGTGRWLQNSHRDEDYSIGDITNNIVITL